MTRYETSKIIKIILSSLIVIGILSYIVFNSRVFIAGPQINVKSPKNGEVFEDVRLIKIEGEALNIDDLKLNDRPISVDEDGNFKESLLLSSGYNIIWLTARDRFEREKVAKIEVVYKGEVEENVIKIEKATSTATSVQETSIENLTSQ